MTPDQRLRLGALTPCPWQQQDVVTSPMLPSRAIRDNVTQRDRNTKARQQTGPNAVGGRGIQIVY